MLDLKNGLFFEDQAGNIIHHDVLFSFETDDGDTYIVHTGNEKDEDDNIMVYASIFNESKYGPKLMNVEDDNDFKQIEVLMNALIEKFGKDE